VPALSWISRLPAPSLAVQRGCAIAAVVAQAGIAVTGSVVRVTGSGLGCPTWPQCAPGSLVPVAHPELGQLHQWVEFGNRMLAWAVGLAAALCVLNALLSRPRRRRVLLLAATMPLGVVAQAVIGGITVLTGLVWWTVALHFLASIPLVWLAVLLVHAVGEGDEPARPHVPRPLRRLEVALAAVLGALLVAGTLVTAAGPHGGDPRTPRLDVSVAALAQGHADLLFLFLGMLVALGFALRATSAPALLWRRYGLLLAAVTAQGALGMVQYWLGVPEALVAFHVLGAALVTVATAALWCASRDRGPVPTIPAETSTPPAPAREVDVPVSA
jgi:cytochrome c oxidase assembly protein subunit 15